MNLKYLLFSVVSAFGVLLAANSTLAQGTAFTYQGRLNDAGNPASGNYDLVFTLFDAQANGTNVSGTITNSTTAVSNGLFAVELDFGAGVFTGPARWLEIGVRTNGGGTFAILTPRQQLTPTPYAITAESANAVTLTLGPGQILVGNAHSNAAAVALSGDITINSNGVTALKSTGSAGTYFETTFNANGQETSGSNPTSLAGFGITDGSTTAGIFTNAGNLLAGNAQGGAVTNLDASVANLLENGRSFSSIISRLPQGGVIYIPTLTGTFYATNVPLTINSNFSGPYIGQFNICPALTLRGTSSHNTIMEFYGANTNFIDQYSAPFGTGTVNLFNLALEDDIPDGGLNSIGYASAPGAGSSAYWNDVSFKDFLIGASTTVSSGEYDNIQAFHNGVGFILAPYSDASILNLIYGFNNTNAALETVSRGNRLYVVATHSDVGVEVGGGGCDDIQLSAEAPTNCGVAIGYATNWPFYNRPFNGNFNTPYTGFCNGNNVFIYPITIHDGYFQGQSVNWTNPFAYNNAALIKVFSTSTIAGVTVRDVDTANGSMPALISYTRSGDTAPYEFDSVRVGSTNLVEFSTSNTIPSQDGSKVTVNLAQNDFTQSVPCAPTARMERKRWWRLPPARSRPRIHRAFR
jgi:hypothetical protein